MRVDLVVNVMDVVDDVMFIAKAMGDAKRAYADWCSEKAMGAIDEDLEYY